jgi:hypothetical protein
MTPGRAPLPGAIRYRRTVPGAMPGARTRLVAGDKLTFLDFLFRTVTER